MIEKIKNTASKDVIRLTKFSILSVLFCGILIFFLLTQMKENKKNVIEFFASQQEMLVREQNEKIKDILKTSTSKNDFEKKVVNDIVKKAENSGSRYWLFGNDKDFIYYKDEETTNLFEAKNIKGMLKYFRNSGGLYINNLEKAISKNTFGTTNYSEQKNGENKVVSIGFIKAYDSNYVIGLSTSENYIISYAKIDKYNINLYIIMGLFTATFLVSIIAYTLTMNKKDKKIELGNNLIREKSIILTENSEKDNKDLNESEKNIIIDELTGLYNRKFFDSTIRILNSRERLSIGVITFIVDKSKCKENDYIIDIAKSLEEISFENKIISRISEDEFSIILLDADKDQSCIMLEEIKLKFLGQFHSLKLIVLIGKDGENKNTQSYKIYKKSYRK
ncbi:diguanylate cyclase domain-containing protein [Inconstantimicrobium mannanitabidum]|uniref:Uncharacterized protein n=1 Tax=Inconstantimicrobium mannanitabidum TaxID=1604901 RepID=A0ACB5RFS5_9CLOT|nr:diguanylate cyclase [Clostridium sp. TW13]GKX67912.1 hypothetical protein rsdtw13_31700 [Clostridium sp. TW13]